MSNKTENEDSYEKKIYEVKDIQNILGIGRSTAYDYIKKVYNDKGPFRVLKIGDHYKVPKESFYRRLNYENED